MFARNQAKQEVERARLYSDMRDFLAVLRRQPNELLPFEWMKQLAPEGEHTLGLQPIPVDSIIGSVDRYREFDRHYLPKEAHLDERWISVRAAQLEGKELPPIQVYKVGGLYFVKDGNHRVSVARRNGQKFIDAYVIELDVTVPPDEHDTLKDLIIKGEYASFLRATRLDEILPGHRPILFTTPGRYARLLEHIHTRQYYLDRKPGREGQPPVTWQEAVRSWYGRLYLRIVDNIDLHDVMYRFPGRTEADLYLWIMDHRYFLTQKYGHDVGSEEATVDFTTQFAPKRFKRWTQRMQLAWTGQLDPDAKFKLSGVSRT
ncbi:ParB N-terminal domain-containing protein [Deinococcus fonticola]|uniref:ParB N-terminal domain-containing protein n=1 Tax=Deinococcus fonticola TaxID=2528713 RepID=UPI001074A220|nr:ParB N-terminal domain-containing protein [Deinococcus fonticola]